MTLLNRRTRVVEQIGQVKESVNLPIYEPKREDEVFANVTRQQPRPADAGRASTNFETNHRRNAKLTKNADRMQKGDKAC